MNPVLIIEPVTGTFVSVGKQAMLTASNTILETDKRRAKNSVPVQWSPHRFEELFTGIFAMLSVVYLVGAAGFTGMLFFYALSH
jgi:hypothetical protein